jgi:hypothetical protein
MNSPPIVTPQQWAQCVAAVNEQRITELTKWRGYLRATIKLLQDHSAIGIHKNGWAFPNVDCDGDIRSIHHGIPPSVAGQKTRWQFDPKDAGKTHPLVWGKLASAKRVAIHESQWDAIAQIDKLGLNPFASNEWAIIATRGAANAKTLEELDIPLGAEVFIFPQSDDVAQRWLQRVIDVLGRQVFIVETVGHKDLNDWGRNGLTMEALRLAIDQAVVHEPKSQPKTKGKAKLAQDREERLAQDMEAAAESVAKSLEAFYDQQRKEYVLRLSDIYQKRTEEQFKRNLRFERLSSALIPHRFYSQVDMVLRFLQENKYVDYAGPLAGKACGFYSENGVRLLVTSQAPMIEPAAGEWPTLLAFLSNLLAGDTEPYGDDQLTSFYGWLKIAYSALRERRFQPGQALAIAGPVEAGKSLGQAFITEILGGRCAKAALYLQGRTDFNGELFGAEHLMLEDEAVSTSHAARVALGANIKNLIANRVQPCHAKYREIVNLAPWWRVSISLNDRPERMLVLPPLDEDMRDKIILLRASFHEMPMAAESPEEKELFWRTLKSELPAFLHWLLEFEIPDDWRNTRFGIRAFHHPQLLAELEELSPAMALLSLIDQAEIWEKTSNVWEGTALELRAMLMQNYKTQRDASRLLEWTNACGQYLNDLAEIRSLRVKQFRTHAKRIYEIWFR